MLLSEPGNMSSSDNISLAAAVLRRLESSLPQAWEVTLANGSAAPDPRRPTSNEGVLLVRSPSQTTGLVALEFRDRLEPRDVDNLTRTRRPTLGSPILIAAPFLSQRVRERLSEAGFAYADTTGNIRLSLSEPGLFIQTVGALENPEPDKRQRRSLKGAKAGRLIRALVDYRSPLGLRELARAADVDAGYASRVVELLDREALVKRTRRGPISEVDWPALLRRWAQEYSPFDRRRARWYLAARGIQDVVDKLKTTESAYAVSGSWAAAQFAPVAPPRALLLYTDRVPQTADALDLRVADAGANVALVTPFDQVVFDRTSRKKGVTVAALSQVAVDLLTSPGRGPNEGEALIEWMQEHLDVWQRA